MTDAWRSFDHPRLSSLPTRRHRRASRIVRAFPFRPRFDFMEDRTLLSTFLVSNTGDSGPGSLRQAILDSNVAPSGTSTIAFAIPGQGAQIISPLSPLPPITNSVLIDGFSQPGYSGTPLIELSGSQAGTTNGLTITGSDVTVRGLDIDNFTEGRGHPDQRGTSAKGNAIQIQRHRHRSQRNSRRDPMTMVFRSLPAPPTT